MAIQTAIVGVGNAAILLACIAHSLRPRTRQQLALWLAACSATWWAIESLVPTLAHDRRVMVGKLALLIWLCAPIRLLRAAQCQSASILVTGCRGLGRVAVSVLSALATRVPAVAYRVDCLVCLERKPITACVRLSTCGHACCTDCWRQLLAAYAGDRAKYPLRCIDPACRCLFSRADVAAWLSQTQLDKFDRWSLQSTRPTADCPLCGVVVILPVAIAIAGPANSRDPAIRRGPLGRGDVPHHGDPLTSSGHDADTTSTAAGSARPSPFQRPRQVQKAKRVLDLPETLVRCTGCAKFFCVTCQVEFHTHQSCREFQHQRAAARSTDRRQLDRSLDLIRRQQYQACPRCGQWVEKTEGCNHVQHTCAVAGGTMVHFCYCCGTELTPNNHHVDIHGHEHFPNGVSSGCAVVHRRRGHCIVM